MAAFILSAAVFVVGALAALGALVTAWPLLAERAHRVRTIVLLAFVAIVVICAIVGQYLLGIASAWHPLGSYR